jgi:cysteine desulfurase
MRRYFDHNATTPVSPEVMAALARVLTECYGNPSSIHADGQAARREVESARASVASLLGCDSKEIVFTSGGTEADNLALLGCAAGHVITTSIEHPAVLQACGALETRGVQVTILPVSTDGIVDPGEVRRALRPETSLISVMHANNETGAIQPIAEIAAIAREAGVLLHSDGVQAAARLPVSVRDLGLDLYAISGHKLNAPKGVGALFVRDGLKLTPMLFGGRHERERRAGTENVPGIASLGAAAKWLVENGARESARLEGLRDGLERRLVERIPDIHINSVLARRTPNTSSISFDGIEGEPLVIALDLAGFSVSSGAACSSGAVHASHVLTAMGMAQERAKSTIRFSIGRTTTQEDVDALIDSLVGAVARLRRLSPVYQHG